MPFSSQGITKRPLFERAEFKDFFAFPRESARTALKKIKANGKHSVLVIDDRGVLLGILTDGDLRTFILSGRPLSTSIEQMFNRSPISFPADEFDLAHAKQVFLKNIIDLIPIIDKQQRVVDFITWSQAFSQETDKERAVESIDLPVVIMAGGKGTRLDPFTKIFPKPLIPIGDKPMIEIIMDEFRRFGIRDFILSLNFKGEMITSYFDSIEKDFRIRYVWEKEFLGTAGGLRLMKRFLPARFVLSNCDIIARADLADILRFHHHHRAEVTILASVRHFRVPYGVIHFAKGGAVRKIVEKPEYSLTINSGVYLLDKTALDVIPARGAFDMPTLIEALLAQKRRVMLYPVNEGDFIDVGQWDEFHLALKKMRF